MSPKVFAGRCQQGLFSDGQEAKGALAYLTDERGLHESFIKSYGVGYCLRSQRVPGEETWRLPKGQRRGLENRKLKARIVVPILDEFGANIVGFAARSPDPKEKGWWNTKFDKHSHMFLFNKARKAAFEHNKMYLVEGYLDALVLHQEGLQNTSSLMGTALGFRRIGLLKRYCNSICLCFDSDANKAGQQARDKSVFEITSFDFDSVSVIDLPLGVDPDEFVLLNGLDELMGLERELTKSEIAKAKKRHLLAANRMEV